MHFYGHITDGLTPAEIALSFCNERLKCDPPVQPSDIDRTHRVGKLQDDGSRPLLIKFATYRARKHVYAARTMLKPAKKQRPPNDPWRQGRAAEADQPDDAERASDDPDDDDNDQEAEEAHTPASKAFKDRTNIWVNEDLTRLRAELLWKARIKKKANDIKDCWSFDGSVIVKTQFNKIVRINSQSMLDRVDEL